MTTNPGRSAARRAPHRAVVASLALAVLGLVAGCGSDDATTGTTPGTASDPSSTAPASPSPTPSPTSSPAATPSEPPAPTSPAVPAGTPGCAEVWVAGGRLPRVYRGCAEGEVLVAADRLGCSSGQALIRYADRYWAVAGGLVREGRTPLLEDPAYLESVESCRA